MPHAPVLFFHCVDAQNMNAQSNNSKSILAHWDAEDLPAAVFHFREPDPIVARNPNVRLIKLPPNRLWKSRALMASLKRYSGVYYPCLDAIFDDHVRRVRRALGLGGSVISTLEGLSASSQAIEAEEARLSSFAGHKVFCQNIDPVRMAGLNGVKSNSDLIITISPFLNRMAGKIWPGTLTAEVPLGVNLDRFHPRGRVPHGTNDRVHVVSAGSFQPRKRPDIFLTLARANPEADFTWFGDGQLRTTLLEQAFAEGLENVRFPGAVNAEALSNAFRQADVFALPSISEGVPKVTQEAAACGLPVVCMEYYETFSVVHGVNGFQAQDDAAYIDYIATLIRDAGMRARMGAISAEMAKGWSWENLAKRWQATVRDAVLCDKSMAKAQ